ncbi:hypothetical protein O6H91_Y028400 [Diphasiastrum complanatum]|nr:hypothetical protein O6H91_Y028400 [Diphasiastrum complanatum]
MVSSGSGSSSSSSDDDTRLPLPQEEESRGGDEGGSDTLTQYELLRLQRIQQNKLKLAALRLPDIASRLASSASEGKAKRLKLLHNECANSERRAKKEKDDKDYEPSDSMGSETQSSDGDEEGEGDGNAQVPSDLKKKVKP